MSSPRAIAVALVVTAAFVLPTTASAWKWTFRTFNLGSGTTGSVTATKCKGDKVGFYNYHGQLGNSQIQHDVTAKMPAFPKFRDFRNVSLTVSGPAVTSLPPDIVAEIVNAFTAFYENTTTRFKKNKNRITFKHPELILFGSQLFPPGTHTERFKPKPGC